MEIFSTEVFLIGYETFRSGRFTLADSVGANSVSAVSVPELFSLSRSGLEILRSGYEIVQKSNVFSFQCKRT